MRVRARVIALADCERVTSLADRPVGELGDDVQVAEVARILLQQVEQNPFERGRVGAVPSGARLTDIGEVVGLDHGATPVSLGP